MTISEQTRHAMYVQLESALGQEAAPILMEHLPPVGWADVATKRDLDHLSTELRTELRAEFGAGISGLRADMYRELGALRGDLRAQMQTLFLGLVGLQMTGAGLAIALSRLL